MQHIADFLSARELLVLGATCARIHCEISRDVWCAQIHARFPYKQRAEQCAPYKFLALLESRVADAPPHGRALVWPGVLCEDGKVPADRDSIPIHDRAQHIAVPRADIILRGDIIETGKLMHMFDGTRCIPTIREPWDDASNILNLSDVFVIPFEFHITYYLDAVQAGDIIMFRVDPRVTLNYHSKDYRTWSYCCDFTHGGTTYAIRCSRNARDEVDKIYEHIKTSRAFSYGWQEYGCDIHHIEPF
jgi:hypothetical protein